MKKLSLLFVAGAISVAATAATPPLHNLENKTLPAREIRGARPSLTTNAQPSRDTWSVNADSHRMSIKEIRKADADLSSPYGDWVFVFYDGYFEEGTLSSFPVQYLASDDGDNYIFFEPYDDTFMPFYYVYNPKDHSLVFPAMFIGQTPQFYVSQEPFIANYLAQQIQYPQTLSFTFNPEGGDITFQTDCGIVWSAYKELDPSTYMGDLDGYYYDDAYLGVIGGGGNDSDNWRDLGNALFMDGWVLPAFGIDQLDSANWYEVPLQQSTVDENYYRLVDPYHLGPIAKNNTSNTKGQIMFDVTDPDHVRFFSVDAGFANPTLQISQFFCLNQLSWYLNMFPEYDIPYIVNKLGDKCPWTTFKDGLLFLGHTVNNGEYWYDANFGNQFMPEGGFDWSPVLGNKWSGNMTTAIYFPDYDFSGVGAITEQDNTEAEYYNLQGVRVTNPEKGQLVIERKGSKATKIIF